MAKITLKGNPVTTSGELPKPGSTVTDFKLVKIDLSEVSLANYAGKRKVLNIFPSIDTPTCSTSVRRFNEKAASLKNTVVLCISQDLPFAQKRWCGLENVTHVTPLSFFRSKECPSAYGVFITDGPLAGLCARAVFVLNPQDEILYYELVSEISKEPDYDQVLAALK